MMPFNELRLLETVLNLEVRRGTGNAPDPAAPGMVLLRIVGCDKVHEQRIWVNQASFDLLYIAMSAHVSERPKAFLAGLTEPEWGFIRELLSDASDRLPAEVFADWLCDQGRDAEGRRVRRLKLEDGDLVVFFAPNGATEEELDSLAERVEQVKRWFPGVAFLGAVNGVEVEEFDPNAMRSAGWLRREEVADWLRSLNLGYLADGWQDSPTADRGGRASLLRAASAIISNLTDADMNALGWVRAEALEAALRR